MLAIETKHPTRYAGLVERRLVDLLADHGLADGDGGRVRVMSFSRTSLRRLRDLAPDLPTVLLADRQRVSAVRIRPPVPPPYARALGPSVTLLRRAPELVARTHARGQEVHVWTVNEPADLELCRGLEVDVVITDRTRAVRSQLADDGHPG